MQLLLLGFVIGHWLRMLQMPRERNQGGDVSSFQPVVRDLGFRSPPRYVLVPYLLPPALVKHALCISAGRLFHRVDRKSLGAPPTP